MYILLGLVLALDFYLVLNLLFSGLVAVTAGVSASSRRPHHFKARALLARRLFPGVVSTLLVLGLFVPSYVHFEPAASRESPGPLLLGLASVSLALLLVSFARAIAALRVTSRLGTDWLKDAAPIAHEGLGMVYLADDAFPPACVLGVLHPKVVVSRSVLAALAPEELQAVLAHEAAHVRRRDNLKRLLLQCAPDALGLLPAGRQLEREWERESELAADASAASGSRQKALDLSAALVAVARLVPERASLPRPFAMLHGAGDVSDRVRKLLEGESHEPAAPASHALLVATGFLAAGVSLAGPALLAFTHDLTESVVRFLH
jgi:hypothetical protein